MGSFEEDLEANKDEIIAFLTQPIEPRREPNIRFVPDGPSLQEIINSAARVAPAKTEWVSIGGTFPDGSLSVVVNAKGSPIDYDALTSLSVHVYNRPITGPWSGLRPFFDTFGPFDSTQLEIINKNHYNDAYNITIQKPNPMFLPDSWKELPLIGNLWKGQVHAIMNGRGGFAGQSRLFCSLKGAPVEEAEIFSSFLAQLGIPSTYVDGVFSVPFRVNPAPTTPSRIINTYERAVREGFPEISLHSTNDALSLLFKQENDGTMLYGVGSRYSWPEPKPLDPSLRDKLDALFSKECASQPLTWTIKDYVPRMREPTPVLVLP